jgi:hypothetical protein
MNTAGDLTVTNRRSLIETRLDSLFMLPLGTERESTTVDKNTALKQIDEALECYRTFRMGESGSDADFERDHTEVMFRMTATINRLSPPGSVYARVQTSTNEHELAGVLKALRADYESDCIQTIRELIHGETFSDSSLIWHHIS